MPLTDHQIQEFQKKIVDLTDTPSENMSPSDLKAYFDSSPEELRVAVNSLIDDLTSTTAGLSGAKQIGVETISGLTGNDVQTLLQALKTKVDTKTDKTGDHQGTWQGLTPGQASEAINGGRLDVVESQLEDIATNVKSFGVKGDGVTDDTQAIKNAFASSKNIYFPPGNYLISVPNTSRESLYWFTDKSNIQIIGNDATLIDANTYSTSAMVNVFAFTRCKNIKIKGLNYEGKTISDPDNQLNNLGTTFAYFEDHCENIEVEAELNNIRYGVRTGDYLNPVYGYCKNFKLNITGKMLGYPVALYLADNTDIKVDVDGVHRAVYLAGVHGANVDCKTKNSYGATIQVLMTNTITTYSTVQSEQRARGCKFIRIKVMDTGSTKFLPYTSLSGIGLQWVAQGTEFSDIDVQFNVRSSDTTASSIAGFQMDSTAKNTNTYYPFNWEPYISIKNVKVSGTIDRTGQTVATNQAGEIFIRGYDTSDTLYEHCPSISNLVIDNVVVNKGAVQSRALYIEVPNLQDTLQINNLQADGIDTIMSARTGKVVLSNSKIKALSVSSLIADLRLDNSFTNSLDNTRISKVSVNNINLGLTNSASGVRQITVTTNGSMTYTVTGALKSTSLTKAIVGVLPGYTASGSWKMGTATDPVLYGTAPLNSSSGYNRFSPFYFNQSTFPLFSNKDLLITFESATTIPSGLSIQIFIFEEEFIVN